jgi:hypothetical protein
MKTKTLHCLLACLFAISLSPLFAQLQVSGTLIDSKQQHLPAATVLLLASADSSLVKGQLSSIEGRFQFESLESGHYLLKISMLGYLDFFSEKFELNSSENPRKDFGSITLNEMSTQLAELSVTAKKPLFEQKIDRIIVNVAGSATNAGNNALQVLQRSPGVLVNRQANGISIAGKNGVIIMINNKVSRMPPDAIVQMLEGSAADNIERIEIIHTPPANFDAEGNAGIINIVMKQSADTGLNGGYSLAAGYGKREKWATGFYFNYRKGKLNLFGNHEYQFDHNPQIFTNYRGIQRDGQFLETDGSSTRAPDLGIHNARLGMDVQLSPKTVVGVVGTVFNRYWDMRADNHIDYRTNGVLDNRVVMRTNEINHWNSLTGNVNFSHQFSKSKTLTADADYVYYTISNPSDYQIERRLGDETITEQRLLKVGKENPISIRVAKVDYVQQFGENTRLETGIKGAASRFDNDVRVENQAPNEPWKIDSALTSRFKLREDVGAAYATVSFKINAKTDVKLGMRYEFTSTNLGSETQPNVVDRQYGSWFPTIYLARAINEKQSVNLAYSRRISRPGFTQLAPYLIFYDPSTSQSGNPALQPSFVDALRLSYQIGPLNCAIEYNVESPSIRDIPIVNVESNTQVTRPENIGKTQNIFSFIAIPWSPKKWWNMQSSLFLGFQKFNFTLEGVDGNIPSGFTGLEHSQSFTMPKGFSADLSAFIVTDNYFGLTKYQSFGNLSIGLRKKMGERWGDIAFNVSDIFLSNNFFGSVNQPELNLQVRNSYQQAERVFKLSWSNKFGNRKLRDARQRERGASEELRRL